MLEETKAGIVFSVKVIPKAHQSQIVGWENNILKIRIKAIPAKGEANTELIRFLSKTLGIAKSQIELIGGDTCRLKRLRITGIEMKKLQEVFST